MNNTTAPRLTMPTRPLTDQRKRYTPAANTDIRKTFEKFSRLARIQALRETNASDQLEQLKGAA